MCRASIFSSDNAMISYFNTSINIIIITDPTFSRILTTFIVFFSHRKFFAKMFFHHFITMFTFFNHAINEIASFPKYDLKGLLNLSSTHTSLYPQLQAKCFYTCLYKTLLDFAFHYFLALKGFQNLHKL